MPLSHVLQRHSPAWIARHIVHVEEQPFDFLVRLSLAMISIGSASLWLFLQPSPELGDPDDFFSFYQPWPILLWVVVFYLQGFFLLMPFKYRLIGYVLGAGSLLFLAAGVTWLLIWYRQLDLWPELLGLYTLALVHLSGARTYSYLVSWRAETKKRQN